MRSASSRRYVRGNESKSLQKICAASLRAACSGAVALAIPAIAQLALTRPANAASTWTGGGASVNWNVGGNWGSTAPTSGTATDIILSGTTNTGTSGSPLIQNIANPMKFNSITFSTGGGAFFIGGANPFDVDGSPTITQSSSSAESITNDFANGGASKSTAVLTLNGSGSGIVTLSGDILEGTAPGNNQQDTGILKDGTSTYLLTSSTSNYKLATTINGGTLLIGANAPSNAVGALGQAASAVLLGNTSGSTNASLMTNGAFTIGRTVNIQAGNSGVIALGGNVDSASTFSGAITANKDFTISQVATTGTNSLNLTGGITSGTAGTQTITFAGPGAINVATGVIGGGTGTLAVNITGGTTTFSVANSYIGLTNITGGTLKYGITNALSTGAVTVNGASAVLDLGANHNDSVGTVTLDGGGQINGTGTSALTTTGSFEMKSGSVSAILAGNLALNKTTTGTVTLTGGNTYTGATAVSAGSLFVNGSTASGSAAAVGDGTNANTGFLSGSGTVSGTVNVKKGGTIAAGSDANTIGKLTTGNETWNGGGKYVFKVNVNDPGTTATAGTKSDELAMSGLTLANTSGNTFTIAITSLLGAAGTAFNGNQSYSWIISHSTTAITGSFNTNIFTLDTSSFHATNYTNSSNNTSSSGTFALSETNGNDDLTLTYTTAAPEPTSLFLLAAPVMPLLLARRRRVLADA